jgi:hypothetical protein
VNWRPNVYANQTSQTTFHPAGRGRGRWVRAFVFTGPQNASAHVPPHVPELAVDQERPKRFMPTGDPTTYTAQLLPRLFVEAKLTDAQQQLFFGLMWDAKQEWDLLVESSTTRAWEMPQAIGDFFEHTNENINRKMREVLTPEQWWHYDHVVTPVALLDEFPIGSEPGEERK